MNVETVRDRQDAAGRRLIAGVSVPDGPLIAAAIDYAQRLSEPYLFNHAMRSWLFAEAVGRIRQANPHCAPNVTTFSMLEA